MRQHDRPDKFVVPPLGGQNRLKPELRAFLTIAATFGLLALGCRGSQDISTPPPGRPLEVFAGIPPLGWVVERVGGSRVHVDVLVHPGQDPHTFDPTSRQAVALGRARLFFKIGLPFESQLAERIGAACPDLTVVDASRGIKRLASGEHAGHEDEAGQGDPHVWLSPRLLQVVAENVKKALCEADPGHAGEYRDNYAALEAQLALLDVQIAKRLAPYRGRRFYVFHPAYGYFADRYGLVQEAVEVEGKPPTLRQLQDFQRKAKADGARTIFLQPRFDPHSAEAVAGEIGGAVVRMDPLAEDVPANLAAMAEKIAASMSTK